MAGSLHAHRLRTSTAASPAACTTPHRDQARRGPFDLRFVMAPVVFVGLGAGLSCRDGEPKPTPVEDLDAHSRRRDVRAFAQLIAIHTTSQKPALVLVGAVKRPVVTAARTVDAGALRPPYRIQQTGHATTRLTTTCPVGIADTFTGTPFCWASTTCPSPIANWTCSGWPGPEKLLNTRSPAWASPGGTC
jgi:hypothetical protein